MLTEFHRNLIDRIASGQNPAFDFVYLHGDHKMILSMLTLIEEKLSPHRRLSRTDAANFRLEMVHNARCGNTLMLHAKRPISPFFATKLQVAGKNQPTQSEVGRQMSLTAIY